VPPDADLENGKKDREQTRVVLEPIDLSGRHPSQEASRSHVKPARQRDHHVVAGRQGGGDQERVVGRFSWRVCAVDRFSCMGAWVVVV
jgi:hypothetical protein